MTDNIVHAPRKDHIVIELDPDVCAKDTWTDLNYRSEFPHPLITCDYVDDRLVQVAVLGSLATRLISTIEALIYLKVEE